MINNFRAQSQLVLSLFHCADLFGRGFDEEGFCVVRAAEIELGFDVKDLHLPANKFDGIIAGTPCQDFSKARRSKPTGNGLRMIREFRRVVTEAQPKWFLLENVPTVPNVVIENYYVQRFDLNANECGLKQNRLRHFQFGSKENLQLHLERFERVSHFEPCCLASEGKQKNRRSFSDFCELQGLPRDFKLPLLSLTQNYKVVGNGVPINMARIIAKAIAWTVTGQSHLALDQSQNIKLCICGCGRTVTGRQKAAKASCRKRIERKRQTNLV